MKKHLFWVCALLGINILVNAQNQVELSLHLKNGDILTGISSLESINFETDFGSLKIPVDKVNSIKVGLNDARFDKGNLLKLLDEIEYGTAKEKETAFDKVVKMDEGAIPFIRAFMESATGGPAYATTDINTAVLYEVMLAKHKVSRNYSINDILTYSNTNKIEGNYSFDALTVATSYGNISVERNDIDFIDVKITSSGGFSNKDVFKVFANENISGNKDENWFNTQILVKKGDKISISATGEVVLASLSGNTYTPDGGVNGAVGKKEDKLNYGQLVYRIGLSGKIQYAGDNFNGYADKTGVIYLAIYETVYNSANTGYYNVAVKAN